MTQKVLVKMGLDCPHSSSLYYFLRENDIEGKGWVKLPMQLIQDCFGITRRSVINRIKKGMSNAFFYDYEITKGQLWIKYVSIKILKSYVYENNFASAKLSLGCFLDINTYKEHLYETAISRQQTSCEKAITKKEQSSKRILNPYNYINSNYAYGCDYRKGNKLFVKKHINCIGASQISLASYLDKSRTTLNKWCNKFPKLQIWKKLAAVLDNPLPDTYTFKKKRKNGVEYRSQYKRMPNYYFVNSNSIIESRNRFKTIYSSAMLQQQVYDVETQRENDINFLLRQKNYGPQRSIVKELECKPCSLADKLIHWFKRKQIIDLVINFYDYLTGQQYNISQFDSYSTFDIAMALEESQVKFNAEQMSMLLTMIERIKNNKHPMPESFLYKRNSIS